MDMFSMCSIASNFTMRYQAPDKTLNLQLKQQNRTLRHSAPTLAATLSTTPGKMAIGAIIVDARTGGKPSAGQCVKRCLSADLSALPFYLGFLWIAWDARKQGWHDKIAGTVAIRRKTAAVPAALDLPLQ